MHEVVQTDAFIILIQAVAKEAGPAFVWVEVFGPALNAVTALCHGKRLIEAVFREDDDATNILAAFVCGHHGHREIMEAHLLGASAFVESLEAKGLCDLPGHVLHGAVRQDDNADAIGRAIGHCLASRLLGMDETVLLGVEDCKDVFRATFGHAGDDFLTGVFHGGFLLLDSYFPCFLS